MRFKREKNDKRLYEIQILQNLFRDLLEVLRTISMTGKL